MSRLGQVRIGHKAPDFHCEAVVGGAMKEVSLSTFIRPSKSPGTPDPDAPWLLLLFIPAAFSFVCPTEVIAFQNCYDEFHDRRCSIAFVSVDTKHSLWHWQNVPHQYGGLGTIDIPLLSDANHKIGRDYGVLVEEEGVSLRGMFIIDGEGLVQQITLNNLTVGRSVLEALRLLEAFQAVAKHGVLCPINWKPSSHASDTLNTISNTLVESYEDRLANLQKEFGDVTVTDLDAKHRSSESTENVPQAEFVNTSGPTVLLTNESIHTPNDESINARDPPPSPGHTSCEPRVLAAPVEKELVTPASDQSKSSHPPSPITAVASPATTPNAQEPPPLKLYTQERTARHSRGHSSAHHHQRVHSAPVKRHAPLSSRPHTYESQGGSHIVLEFADPTLSPMVSPNMDPNKPVRPAPILHRKTSPPAHLPSVHRRSAPTLSRATSWSGVLKREGSSAGTSGPGRTTNSVTFLNGSNGTSSESSNDTANGNGSVNGSTAAQTRLQAAFLAVKKMSAGLSSPRVDYAPSKQKEGGRNGGYFDVTAEEGAS